MASNAGTEADDKAYYDTEDFDLERLPKYLEMVDTYARTYRGALARHSAAVGRRLVTLELGAGSCTLSLLLSREPWVERMHCADISTVRMEKLAPIVAGESNGRLGLLRFDQVNLSDALHYPDGTFDVVLFDASLHHSRNIWLTLSECRRVLRNDGVLIAQREQYLAPLTGTFALHRILRSPEVRAGVSENAYFRSQYDYYLRAAGFLPTFKPVSHGMLSAIAFLNGIMFSKWSIVAHKSAAVPALD